MSVEQNFLKSPLFQRRFIDNEDEKEVAVYWKNKCNEWTKEYTVVLETFAEEDERIAFDDGFTDAFLDYSLEANPYVSDNQRVAWRLGHDLHDTMFGGK